MSKLISIGDTIKAPVKNTGGRTFSILEQFTAEVLCVGSGTGRVPRVNCYLAVDKNGKEYFLVTNDHGNVVSSHHRTISMIREVENMNGEMVKGDLKDRVDMALNMLNFI